MFTGLVEALGTVERVESDGAGGRLLVIGEPLIAEGLPLGASVAVNGACLTVVDQQGPAFSFQASPETLRLTNLGELQPGHRVNLERSLRFGDRLGGHLVQGHVDGLGKLDRRLPQGEWETMWFSAPPELARQLVRKGSVSVDGVSLTVVDVSDTGFSVALIPHTLQYTTLGFKQPPAAVNLETDLLGKYVWKYLEAVRFPEPG